MAVTAYEQQTMFERVAYELRSIREEVRYQTRPDAHK